jgi:hypothetical protein
MPDAEPAGRLRRQSPTRVTLTSDTFGDFASSALIASIAAARSKAPSQLMRWKHCIMMDSSRAASFATTADIHWSTSEAPSASSPFWSDGHAAGTVCAMRGAGAGAVPSASVAARRTGIESEEFMKVLYPPMRALRDAPGQVAFPQGVAPRCRGPE